MKSPLPLKRSLRTRLAQIVPARVAPLPVALALFAATLPICIGRAAAADTVADPVGKTRLIEALRSRAMPIALKNGRLQGAGADWIARESVNAQFVLIGEDHGMVEPPAVAAALLPMQDGTSRQLVIEIGPHATTEVERALRARDDGLATLNSEYPTAIPFFNWREDGAMAAAAVAGRRNDALCGVDQEFILSGRQLFRTLATLAPNAASAALAETYAAHDDALYAQMSARRDPDAALLTRLEAGDFGALRKAFAGRADALALIADLETSAEIYRLQSSDPGRSNALRSALMKRNFMRCLRSPTNTGAPPRMLLRMGAFHVGRGRSPLGIFDLGNLASELAQSNGLTSLHLLVIAGGGEVNRWYPFAPEAAAKRAPYDAKAELDVIGANSLLDAADDRGWTLIPLAPLRADATLRRASGKAFEELVYAYDAAIVIPQAQAATFYGDVMP